MGIKELRAWAETLKREVHALYLAFKHPGTPWYAKLVTFILISYAFSPIDLIPDFIPILGYLDDLILLPLGIKFAKRLIPDEVMAECRESAKKIHVEKKRSRGAALIIIIIWALCITAVIRLISS